jgi:NADH-quinone oxidoreductase subunit B
VKRSKSTAASLRYFVLPSACCGDEWTQAFGARYDLERLGLVEETNPEQADLLVITGGINELFHKQISSVYERMARPKFVMAIGSCAISGGAFSRPECGGFTRNAAEILSVDVFVPGCPPRPEAIMNGILTLQEKIRAEPNE